MADRSPIDRVWLNVDEANQRTGVSQTDLYEALRSKELKGYRRADKGKWRIHVDELDAWMRGERVPNLRSA